MNRKVGGILSIAAALLLAGGALAQDKGKMPEMTAEQKAEMDAWMQAATPGEPHKTLASAAGSYDMVVKSWHEPGGPVMEEKGTAKRAMMLEGRIMTEDVTSTMMGMPFKGHGMTGYDNVTGKYWSTWNDNMGTGVLISEGTCDAQGNCTYTGTYNDAVKKAPVTVKMTSRWPSPTTQIFEMHGPSKDGTEFKMMEITYTKKGGAKKK